MVDRAVLAEKIAAIRDAVARIREVLPASSDELLADRTLREIVVLNLFFAIQDCLALAAHWLADAGLDVPQAYADVFRRLGDRGVIEPDLAARLAAAAGLRNLVAHRYGALDWRRRASMTCSPFVKRWRAARSGPELPRTDVSSLERAACEEEIGRLLVFARRGMDGLQ